MKKIALVLITTLGFAQISYAACKKDPKLAAKGKEAYANNCVTCHGVKGDVTGPEAAAGVAIKARNLVADAFKHPKGATIEGIADVIEKGLPGTAMASFSHIAEPDRCAVANYVLSLRKAKK